MAKPRRWAGSRQWTQESVPGELECLKTREKELASSRCLCSRKPGKASLLDPGTGGGPGRGEPSPMLASEMEAVP